MMKTKSSKSRRSHAKRQVQRQLGFLTPKGRRMHGLYAMGVVPEEDRPPAAKDLWKNQSAADKDLWLAFQRIPFRIQRVARALKKGASFLTVVPIKHIDFTEEDAGTQPYRLIQTVLGLHGYWLESRDEFCGWWSYDQWSDNKADFRAIWDWMKHEGVDFSVKSPAGERFEHLAFITGNTAALSWWKQQGKSFESEDPEDFKLEEIAIVRDKLHLIEGFQECFKDVITEASMEAALSKTASLIVRRWSHGKDEGGVPLFKTKGHIRARIALANAATLIAKHYPDAVGANRDLSALMELMGVRRKLSQIVALETRSLANQERDELAKVIHSLTTGLKRARI